MGIKCYDQSGFAHRDKPTPHTSMQMQSHAQADRCSGFLPNVWAYEIISAFHLLVRIWFIKWPPTTVLIYKANWGVWCAFFSFFFSPFSPQRGLRQRHPASRSHSDGHWEASPEELGVKCLASALSHQLLRIWGLKWRKEFIIGCPLLYFMPVLVQ